MISKEDARLIYNLHAQIESTEEIISKLHEFVKEQDANIPDIIDDKYNYNGSITINIPYFDARKFDTSRGVRVFNISYHAALRVLENHLESLKEQIYALSERVTKGG